MHQSETKYFDLHIDGIGYLNRAREVTPQRVEPDPIDERPVTAPTVFDTPPEEPVANTGAEPVDEEARLAEIFGELWPLGDEVKLDPTVDRVRFRQRRDTLRELGCRFQPVGQLWDPVGAEGR